MVITLKYPFFSTKIFFFFQDLRRKAARLVATKSTLAARVDAAHESIDGQIGMMLKEDIEKKLDKLTVTIL